MSSLDVEARDASASLDDETQKFIAQSLTDVDLFASYGLTQKAIGLLEAILRRAPRHTPTIEKLLDFVLGAGDDRRTAELAARLETLHGERGDSRNAERFAELRRRFQRAAGLSDAELAATSHAALSEQPRAAADSSIDEEEFAAFEVAPEPTAAEPPAREPVPEIHQPQPEQPVEVSASQTPRADVHDVHEVDLSEEWLSVLKEVSTDKPEQHPEAVPASEATDFEISTESVSVEDASDSAHAEPVHPPSPLIPPPEMPAYAEFQVNAETPSPVIEEPDFTSEVKADVASPVEVAPSAEVARPAEVAPPAELYEAVAPPPRPSTFPRTLNLRSKNCQLSRKSPRLNPPRRLKKCLTFPNCPPTRNRNSPPWKPVTRRRKSARPNSSQNQNPNSSSTRTTSLFLIPSLSSRPMTRNLPDVPIEVHEEAEPEPELEHSGRNSAARPGAGDFASDQFLADLASEIEHLGMGGALTPAFSTAATEAPVKMQDTANLSDSGPLKEVFDDFRAELGEMGSDDEDLETHYNLGTAFREMGLLEEAISEFQKVAKANERGRPFRYAMQCCTLLGLAFMEKGQPAIAAIWYERALETPGVEPESILALRYDLGIAQESAGEPEAALKSFSKVYAMNIDYRDVAERIAALQKPSR